MTTRLKNILAVAIVWLLLPVALAQNARVRPPVYADCATSMPSTGRTIGEICSDKSGILHTWNGSSWGIASGWSTPTTTQGDMILRGVTSDQRLPIGSDGTCLKANGTSAYWDNCSSYDSSPFFWSPPLVSCLGGGASVLVQTGTTYGVTASCSVQPNVILGKLVYLNDTNVHWWTQYSILPKTITSATARMYWQSGGSDNVKWSVYYRCVPNGGEVNAAGTLLGTATQSYMSPLWKLTEITGTITGCVSGNLIWVRVERNTGEAADTLANTVQLYSFSMVAQ